MLLPEMLQLEPVGFCNLACPMCPVSLRTDSPANGSPAFLPFTMFTRILEEMPDLKTLQLQGLGEPFLHPQLLDMIAYASQRGLRVSTTTNLTIFSQRIARRLEQVGLHRLDVSVDSVDRVVYERLRTGARFARLIRNLGVLRSSTGKFERRLIVVLMNSNLKDLGRLVLLAAEFNFDSVWVQNLIAGPGKFGETELVQPGPETEQAFAKAREASLEEEVGLRLPDLTGFSSGKPCHWPWHGMFVDYQGNAVPCCMIARAESASLGNVLEQGMLPTWNSQPYEDWRSQLSGDQPPQLCRNCRLYNGTF